MLVVGGGISGAAVAWDAALRGLKVALVEAGDFGGATSWNSLKTIHGGLRHLQRGDLAAVRASSRERTALLRIAPGLVRPLPFLVPTYGHGLEGREALRVALLANDLLTAARNDGLDETHRIPPGRMLSAAEVLERVPSLPTRGLTGGGLWMDAQVESSERLVLAFLHSAAAEGAVLANHAAVETLDRESGRVVGATCRDATGGGVFEVRARVTIDAAGPAVDSLLAGASVAAARAPLRRAWNLVLRHGAVSGMAVGAAQGGRFLFLVPWRDRAIVGTGYAEPDAGPAAVRAFLDDAARAFPWADIRAQGVTLVHDGLVPGTPRALWGRHRVRDHARDGAPGLLSALGVKFTGARGLAEAAVDLAFGVLGRPRQPSRTHETPLRRAEPLAGSLADMARTAARDEMAMTLTDAVARRLPLGAAGAPDPAELSTVAAVLSDELGWDEGRRAAERAELDAFYAARTIA